jgi:large subunit ribosomal protein L31e
MAETKTQEKIEREYIIPLRRRWKLVPRYKKTNKAVKAVKEFLVRHMKIRDRDLKKIKLDKYLNEALWHRGIKNPPSKIKVRAIREGDVVRVSAVQLPESIKFKKLREEKIETQAKKIAEKKKEEKKQEVSASVPKEDSRKKAEEAEAPKVEPETEKKEEEEKKAATIEAGKEIEKAAAKKEKHTTKVKSPKQEKNQRVAYNQSSRGH